MYIIKYTKTVMLLIIIIIETVLYQCKWLCCHYQLNASLLNTSINFLKKSYIPKTEIYSLCICVYSMYVGIVWVFV